MNALVPDLAMVPKLLMRSALVIPMPESWMVKVLFALSGISLILRSGSVFNASASVKEV